MRVRDRKNGFRDGNGNLVQEGDMAEYRFEPGLYEVLEIYHDGEAIVRTPEGMITEVKWHHLAATDRRV